MNLHIYINVSCMCKSNTANH